MKFRVSELPAWMPEREKPQLLAVLTTLFKLRIVGLLLLAALGGAMLGIVSKPEAHDPKPAVGSALALLMITGALSAGGASAINQYLERERDRLMTRTRQRPLPAGQVACPGWVLWAGTIGVVLGVALAARFNRPLACFVALGAVIYVGVYTIWLKPRSVLNIVIGGAAGSCAVLSGGAAVEAWKPLSVWLLAAMVFFWTPVHFWSLALAYRADYAHAGFPMLTVQTSPAIAARWIALHAGLTALLALALGILPSLSPLILASAALGTLGLAQRTLTLIRQPGQTTALAVFRFSNIYLAVVLAGIVLSAVHYSISG